LEFWIRVSVSKDKGVNVIWMNIRGLNEKVVARI
jgi:hypothetical protein